MRVDSNNEYMKNQCSLVIRADGEEIEIPVTFGMTADEIRMIYPFLLPLLNDKILNPAVQFVKANECGLLSDLTEEEYRNELIRVTEQSKYWYEKPSAGLLDIAVRFAIDIKMRGIEDLDFIFNRTPVYDPVKIKPVTASEASVIMQKLRIEGTEKDLDAFSNLGKDIEADSPVEDVIKRDEARVQRAEEKDETYNTEAVKTAKVLEEKLRASTNDILTNLRDSDADISYDTDKVDADKYKSKYDPNAKVDTTNGILSRFAEDDRWDDEQRAREEALIQQASSSVIGSFDDLEEDLLGLGNSISDDSYDYSESSAVPEDTPDDTFDEDDDMGGLDSVAGIHSDDDSSE